MNKTSNAVRLRHTPTNVTVRCHDTRSLEQNRKIAWKRLIEAVDLSVNGEESVKRQIERAESERRARIKEDRKRKREAKQKDKQEEEQDGGGDSEADGCDSSERMLFFLNLSVRTNL